MTAVNWLFTAAYRLGYVSDHPVSALARRQITFVELSLMNRSLLISLQFGSQRLSLPCKLTLSIFCSERTIIFVLLTAISFCCPEWTLSLFVQPCSSSSQDTCSWFLYFFMQPRRVWCRSARQLGRHCFTSYRRQKKSHLFVCLRRHWFEGRDLG